MDKRETVVRICSLRAGLSAIACEKDRADEILHAAALEREEIKRNIEKEKLDLDQKIKMLEKSKIEFAKEKQKIRLEAKSEEIKLESSRKKGFSLFKKKEKVTSPSPTELAEQKIATLASGLETFEKKVMKRAEDFPKLKDESEALIARKDNEAYARVREIGSVADAMLGSLCEIYSPIIHKSDWDSIDLIIFYLESGRADDLKEALQLLDRERQARRLEDALVNATGRLENIIVSSVSSLESTIKHGLASLENEISIGFAEQQRAIRGAATDIKATITESSGMIDKRLSDLCNAESLNGALLKKLNTNSTALLGECEQLCSLTRATNEELEKIYTSVSRPR